MDTLDTDLVTFSLEGASDSLPLPPRDYAEFAHRSGSTGLWMPPVENRYRSGSGVGATFMGRRVKERPVLLRVGVNENDRAGFEAALQRLATLAQDDSLQLVATYPDSTRWFIPLSYESGLEGNTDDVNWAVWNVELSLVFTAPDPFWRRADASTLSLEAQGDVPGFLSALARLRLGVSQAIGNSIITNPGTVPAQVRWRFRGPADAGTSVSINGEGFEITSALSASDVVVVDASQVGLPAVTLNGSRDYSILAKAPKFPKLLPGNNAVSLTMPGAVPSTWEKTDIVEAINEIQDPVIRHGLDAFSTDGGFIWAANGDQGSAVFSSGTEVAAAMFVEFTTWSQSWVSTVWKASGDESHLFIEQLDSDGNMIETDYSDDLALSGIPVDSSCVKLRIGVGFYGESGTITAAQVVFQQPGYELFTGDSGLGYGWETIASFTGEEHKSTSQLVTAGDVQTTNLVFDPTCAITDYKSSYFGGDASGSGAVETAEFGSLPEGLTTFFRMTQNSSDSPSGTTPEVFQLSEAAIDSAVSPGDVRTASLWIRSSVAGQYQLGIAWEKSDGSGLYPYSSGAAVTAAVGEWVQLTAKGTAPTDAAKFRLVASKVDGSVSPAGSTYDVTGVISTESWAQVDFFAPSAQPLSRSIKYVLEKHGGSLVEGSFHAGKEVVV